MTLKTLAVALLSAAAAVGLSVSAALAQVAEVNIDSLNVRSGPGLTHGVRGTIPRGAQAKIIETQGDWLYIVTGPIEGWVYAPYVTVLNQSGPGVGSAATTVMVCNGTSRTTARVYRQNGELKLRVHDRLDNLRVTATVGGLDLAAPAVDVADHVAEVILGSHDLDLHHRLEDLDAGLLRSFAHRAAARDLER